jgi:hypothetical protein
MTGVACALIIGLQPPCRLSAELACNTHMQVHATVPAEDMTVGPSCATQQSSPHAVQSNGPRAGSCQEPTHHDVPAAPVAANVFQALDVLCNNTPLQVSRQTQRGPKVKTESIPESLSEELQPTRIITPKRGGGGRGACFSDCLAVATPSPDQALTRRLVS